MNPKLELVTGDITKLEIEAIVNAANSSLLGGGGVDGAIHRAAGRELEFECRLLHGCKTGEAKLTKGYRLPAKFILHTVGPVWQDGSSQEPELLANCYRNTFTLAHKHGIKSLAFPAISTGIYRFPKALAAEIAVRETLLALENNPDFERVVFVVFDAENEAAYRDALSHPTP